MNLVYSLDGAKLGKVKCPNPLKFLKCTRIILKERGKNTQDGWGFSDLWILIDSFWGVANARFRMEGAARRKKLSAVETPQIEYKLLLLWAGCGFRERRYLIMMEYGYTLGVSRLSRL